MVLLGEHDVDTLSGGIEVIFSKQGDTFIPLGCEKNEILEDSELIYFDDNNVRTRRWIWRQSE